MAETTSEAQQCTWNQDMLSEFQNLKIVVVHEVTTHCSMISETNTRTEVQQYI